MKRYNPAVWVLFSSTGRAHLVERYGGYSDGSGMVRTSCKRVLTIRDCLMDAQVISGFDDRACQQCRRGWNG